MRTQSHVESDARAASAGDRSPDTVTFRADSLDAAVALAEESLGAPVRVVSANRIRRGGIGGFFASDLGVEVSVALEDETIEQALERLVSESSVDERARWLEHRAADRPPTRPASAIAGIDRPVAPEVVDVDPVVRIAQRDEEPSLVRVEQIIEELQFLTRQPPTATDTRDVEAAELAPEPAREPSREPGPRAVVVPTLPPRPADIARAAAVNAAASQAHAIVVEEALARRAEISAASPLPSTRALATPSTSQLASPRAPWPATAAGALVATAPTAVVEVEAHAPTDSGSVSQREVELAVAATDQLIESLQRDMGARRVSVRVILRTGDQQAVEAEAEWEAP